MGSDLTMADVQADELETLVVDYLKAGASDPLNGEKLAQAGVDLSIGIITLGLTALGVPGAGAALGALKSIFFGNADSVPDAVTQQFELIKKDINALKADVGAIQQALNQLTVKSAMDANIRRTQVVVLALSDVKDLALELPTAANRSAADKQVFVERALNRASTFLSLEDDIWTWDNVRVRGRSQSNGGPQLDCESVPDLNLALTPYLQAVGVLAAAIDTTGVRPAQSKLQPHVDKLHALSGSLVGPAGDLVTCKTVAGPYLRKDSGQCSVTLRCTSAYATRTKSLQLAPRNDPNHGLQCVDDPSRWNNTFDDLRVETWKINSRAIEAIANAAAVLDSAGKFKGYFGTSPAGQMDTLYAADEQGRLYKFQHLITTSTPPPRTHPAGAPNKVSSWLIPQGPQATHDLSRAKLEDGLWNGFSSVVVSEWKGSDLFVYGIEPAGDLIWRRIGNVPDGPETPPAPVLEAPGRVGNGWAGMRNVFSMGEGIIYAVAPNGALVWYHHMNNLDGTLPAQWEQHPVGTNWNQFTHLMSPGEGVIYAVRGDGKLLWYKHNAYRTGGRASEAGAWEGPREIGSGWGSFAQVLAVSADPADVLVNPTGTRDAHIYAVNLDGELLYYVNRDMHAGVPTWDAPVTLAAGWSDFRYVFVAMGTRPGGPVVK